MNAVIVLTLFLRSGDSWPCLTAHSGKNKDWAALAKEYTLHESGYFGEPCTVVHRVQMYMSVPNAFVSET